MKRLFDLFPEILRKQPQKQLPPEEIVRQAWGHIAGRQIAQRSQVFRIFNDILIVHVPDKTWRRQLHRFEAQLVARVNYFMGRDVVRSLDFRVDPSMPARIPPKAAEPRAAAAAAPRQGELFARPGTGTGPSAWPGTGRAEGLVPAEMPPRKGPARELAPAVEAEIEQAAGAIADPELRELFLRASRKMVK